MYLIDYGSEEMVPLDCMAVLPEDYWEMAPQAVPFRVIGEYPGPRLNIKTVLSTYGDFHVKDKTAVRTSYL